MPHHALQTTPKPTQALQGPLPHPELARVWAGLKRRGDLTLWLDEAAIAGWHASRRTTPGGQARYSNLAIELVLTLRLVFHLGLRQAEGFVTSVLRLLGLELPVPDHTTLAGAVAPLP